MEDFRCEFEGSLQVKGKVATELKVGKDGVYESFSGLFIWKNGGDTYCDSLLRRTRDDQITRESLVVRMREKKAEFYQRLNDAKMGHVNVDSPNVLNSWRLGCYGRIFLIDKLKRDAAAEIYDCTVDDEQADAPSVKVVTIKLKAVPEQISMRFWVDLQRSGHVVKEEHYAAGNAVSSRIDIKLARFKLGDGSIWMPVSGEFSGYGAREQEDRNSKGADVSRDALRRGRHNGIQ